jgi:hypothetical protein
MDKNEIKEKVLSLASELYDKAGITQDKQRGVELSEAEVVKRVKAQPGSEYFEDLLLLQNALDRREPVSMSKLIFRGYDAVKTGQQIPREWVEFVFELLRNAVIAAEEAQDTEAKYRKIAQAVYLAGRNRAQDAHYAIVAELLSLEFEHRRDPDPLGRAIDELRKNPAVSRSGKDLKSIYRKNCKRVLNGLQLTPYLPGDYQQWVNGKLTRL